MYNFLLIAVCLLAGILIGKYKALPPLSYKAVNAWIINIALPSIALKYLPEIDWNPNLIFPFLMPLIVWTGSYLFINFFGRFIKMDVKTRAALLLTAGLGNTSFLGFPLSEAYYGEAGLQVAILCDQACFLVMATFGILTATKASSGGSFKLLPIVKKILRFPPFIAFCLAFILPPIISLRPLEPLLSALGSTLIPLALFSVGLQLKLKIWREDARLINLALSYKLLVAPVLVMLIALLFGIGGFAARMSIFEAAMAPMVTGAILATDYDLNPRLANIVLSIGIPLSLLTTFLWTFVLEFI